MEEWIGEFIARHQRLLENGALAPEVDELIVDLIEALQICAQRQ